MMETIIIAVIAFATSILTFLSGFGLGTILIPVFVIFFPVDLSIAPDWRDPFLQQSF